MQFIFPLIDFFLYTALFLTFIGGGLSKRNLSVDEIMETTWRYANFAGEQASRKKTWQLGLQRRNRKRRSVVTKFFNKP